MNRNWIYSTAWLLLTNVLAIAPMAQAELLLQGNTTVRAETVDTDGLQSASPYPIEGGHHYVDIDAYLEYQKSAYESISGQFTGVLNDSAYRFPDQGFSPERMFVRYEKGDGTIPFRLTVGDYLGYFSYLTFQRSLKGVQLELQPDVIDDALTSFVAFAGENDNEWRHLGLGHNTSMGMSWSVDFNDGARYLINYVQTERDKNVLPGLGDIEQKVVSLGYENAFHLPGMEVEVHAEAGFFDGDHDGGFGAPEARDEQAEAFYAEARGRSLEAPLDWIVRGEKYDKDYLPQGAIVPAGRRSLEAFGHWRFETGLRLQARIQHFKDGQGTALTTKTTTRGLALTGQASMAGRPVSTNVDIYRQDVNNSAGADVQNVVFNGRFGARVSDDWSARLELFHRDADDQTLADADTKERLIKLSGDRLLSWRDFRINMAPGLSYRKVNGGSGLREIWPTLNLRATRQNHELRLFYGHQDQSYDAVSGTVFPTGTLAETLSLEYNFRHEQHLFGLEAQWYERRVEDAQDSRNVRLSAFWRYEFDESQLARLSGDASARRPAQSAPSRSMANSDIFLVAPWSSARISRTLLRAKGVSAANTVAVGQFDVYEVQWLDGIDLRQRVGIEEVEGTVATTALIIEFDNLGNTDSTSRSYDRVRNALIRRYGTPDATFEEGRFDQNFVAAVNQQRLVRVDEWQTEQGVLRFGIPRRLDGMVRMELQHKDYFGPVQDTLWSVESIR